MSLDWRGWISRTMTALGATDEDLEAAVNWEAFLAHFRTTEEGLWDYRKTLLDQARDRVLTPEEIAQFEQLQILVYELALEVRRQAMQAFRVYLPEPTRVWSLPPGVLQGQRYTGPVIPTAAEAEAADGTAAAIVPLPEPPPAPEGALAPPPESMAFGRLARPWGRGGWPRLPDQVFTFNGLNGASGDFGLAPAVVVVSVAAVVLGLAAAGVVYSGTLNELLISEEVWLSAQLSHDRLAMAREITTQCELYYRERERVAAAGGNPAEVPRPAEIVDPELLGGLPQLSALSGVSGVLRHLALAGLAVGGVVLLVKYAPATAEKSAEALAPA